LQRRITDLEKFEPTSIKERWAPETKALETSIGDALSQVFGYYSSRYRRFQSAANLDHGGLVMWRRPFPLAQGAPWLTEGKADTLALLNEAVKSLREDLADIENSPTPQPPATQTMLSNEIFIVRGHDGSAKVEVARLIEHAGLMAVILHEQPNAGRTIIEKFEHHAGALGFAVAILTPDDVGGPDKDHLRARARQNVVGELFWFAGKLGRACVCALRKGDVEIPSDFAGVVYTEMDDRGAWRAELLRELQNAGYTVDWAKALA